MLLVAEFHREDSRGNGVTSKVDAQWHYPGARWWKFDFHTHSPASEDYGKGPRQHSLREITPRDWLLGFMRAEIDCIAVTDHNSGDWVDRLKGALLELRQGGHKEFRPLHLFPGVEITANSGVHVLALLDVNRESADVAALLGWVRYRGQGARARSQPNHHPSRLFKRFSKLAASRFWRMWMVPRAHGICLAIRWRRCLMSKVCSPSR